METRLVAFLLKKFFNVEIGMRLSYSCKNQVYHVDVLCHLGLAGWHVYYVDSFHSTYNSVVSFRLCGWLARKLA